MIVPDYFEPLVAFRSWRVQANGLLSGLAVAQPWVPRRALAAVCNGHGQARTGDIAAHLSADGWKDAPVMGCVCGIYALKSHGTAEQELSRWRSETAGGFLNIRVPSTAAYAIGEVSLWGTVIDHPLGYRAQFAYPKAVTVYGSQELADRVATLYGVSVERADEPKPKDELAERWYASRLYFSPQPLSIGQPVVFAWDPATPDPTQSALSTYWHGLRERVCDDPRGPQTKEETVVHASGLHGRSANP